MRRLYEIALVIAAAGLAAAVALIEIPTHSAGLGIVVGGGSLMVAPSPIGDSSFPPLPPSLLPPDSSTLVPIESPATPVPLAPGVQAGSNVVEASASAMGSLGASSAQDAPTSPTTKAPATLKKAKQPPAAKPKLGKAEQRPAAKPKPPPTSKKSKPSIKPKPPNTSRGSVVPPPAAKPKAAPHTSKPKGELKT